jgi:hypothetical protein
MLCVTEIDYFTGSSPTHAEERADAYQLHEAESFSEKLLQLYAD